MVLKMLDWIFWAFLCSLFVGVVMFVLVWIIGMFVDMRPDFTIFMLFSILSFAMYVGEGLKKWKKG